MIVSHFRYQNSTWDIQLSKVLKTNRITVNLTRITRLRIFLKVSETTTKTKLKNSEEIINYLDLFKEPERDRRGDTDLDLRGETDRDLR